MQTFHITDFHQKQRTAAILAAVELQSDEYHQTIHTAAAALLAQFPADAHRWKYHTQWTDGSSCWLNWTAQQTAVVGRGGSISLSSR